MLHQLISSVMNFRVPRWSLTPKIIFLVIVFRVSTVQAQVSDSSHEGLSQDKWIETLDDYIGLKLGVSNYIETFSLNVNDNAYTLYPNTSNVARLYFNFRMISLYYTYVPLFLPGNNDDDTKGKTSSAGYGIDFTFNRISTSLSYSRTEGYYLKNTLFYNRNWEPGDDYILFPDLVSKSLDGETSYKFNKNFSQSAVSSQTSRQLRSAGSFIPKLIYKYYLTENQPVGAAQKSENFQLILGAGYYYTYVLKKKFYISGGVMPAVGYMFTALKFIRSGESNIEKKNIPIGQISGQAGAGYNGRLFYAGAYWSGSTAGYKPKNATAINTNSTLYYQFFVGYRFKAPKFLRKSYDDVMDFLVK
jgi:hypothetical protein